MTTATATTQATDFVWMAMDPMHGSHLDIERSELAEILRCAAIEVNSDPDVVACAGLAPEPELISVDTDHAIASFEDGSYIRFDLIEGLYTDGMQVFDGVNEQPVACF